MRQAQPSPMAAVNSIVWQLLLVLPLLLLVVSCSWCWPLKWPCHMPGILIFVPHWSWMSSRVSSKGGRAQEHGTRCVLLLLHIKPLFWCCNVTREHRLRGYGYRFYVICSFIARIIVVAIVVAAVTAAWAGADTVAVAGACSISTWGIVKSCLRLKQKTMPRHFDCLIRPNVNLVKFKWEQVLNDDYEADADGGGDCKCQANWIQLRVKTQKD